MAILAVKQADSSEPPSEHARFVAALFEREREAIMSYLLGLLRHRADAEDMLQETYMRLLQTNTLERESYTRARSYAFKVATNLAYARFRKRKEVSVVNIDHAGEYLTSGDTTMQILDFEQSLDAIKQALLSLEPCCRRVFLLRTAEGISYEMIAVKLSISKRTVEREMKRALDVCQEKLRGGRET